MILVTGFGPFLDVQHNPSGAMARSCHGLRVFGETIWGLEIPVSYSEGIRQTLDVVRRQRPRLVLGIGVARQASAARLEAYAYRDYTPMLKDVDGRVGTAPDGPPQVASTMDVPRLCRHFGVTRSTDPGRYVCNAWLYEVVRGSNGTPVSFLHIPPQGFALGQLVSGLDGYLRSLTGHL